MTRSLSLPSFTQWIKPTAAQVHCHAATEVCGCPRDHTTFANRRCSRHAGQFPGDRCSLDGELDAEAEGGAPRVDREVSVAPIERGAWPQLQPRRTDVVEVEPLQPRPVLSSHRRGLFFSYTRDAMLPSNERRGVNATDPL
jgi:hypothetical protein